jgi:membrane protein DedA with SNARE-associated domain
VDGPEAFLARWHYAGLFVVILVEEAGVPLPVPGDLFIAAMGVMAQRGGAAFLPTVAVVTVATVLGATALFLVSRHVGRPLIIKVARRLGYTEAREARLEEWLLRRGAVAVVVGRHVPGLRILMTVAAGALRLPHTTFVVGTFFAGVLWATIYFWIGYGLGAGWQGLAARGAPGWLVPAGAAAAVLVAVGLAMRRRMARRRRPDEVGRR